MKMLPVVGYGYFLESPNIKTCSDIQVMRIKKVITKDKMS